MNDFPFHEYSRFDGVLDGDDATAAGMLLIVARMAYDPRCSPDAAARRHARDLLLMMLDAAQGCGFAHREQLLSHLQVNEVSQAVVSLAKAAAACSGTAIFDAIYTPMHLRTISDQAD